MALAPTMTQAPESRQASDEISYDDYIQSLRIKEYPSLRGQSAF